jgi:hypothetical protein
MYNTNRKRHIVGGIIGGVASVLILVAAAWLFFNRQYIVDVATVWSYEPSSEIAALSERVDFTDEGEFYFYATRPEIAPAEQFNEDCPRQETNSPILGCYAAGRIYIYDITNEQLNGIEEVTAAHEMLHAVWERHGNAEQRRLESLLMAIYRRGASPELKERMAYYERNEPSEVINELHSILPTEVTDLGPELDAYYATYFTDRSTVVAYHEQYSDVFNTLVDRADALYNELNQLSSEVEQESAEYTRAVEQLSADIESFNRRASNGSFTSMSQFNSERNILVARSNELDTRRQAITDKINAYNTKYEEYQRLGSELDTLNESIDSIKGLEEAPAL